MGTGNCALGTETEDIGMWYFTWILGVGLALAFGIINVMWLEASYSLGDIDEEHTKRRFKERSE